MKNIANAERPKSAGAMLPPRPLRESGKVAQTARNSDRRDGKSCTPTLNQTFADSRIRKISKLATFRIAGKLGDSYVATKYRFVMGAQFVHRPTMGAAAMRFWPASGLASAMSETFGGIPSATAA
jgi:hypothetical protein